MGPQLVTPEDHDAGFKDLAMEYRRKPAPPGLPETIRVRALTYIEADEVNRHYASDDKRNENFWRLSVLLNALPEPHNSVEFLNRLKPSCVNQIMIAALHLACGAPDEPSGDGSQDKKKRIGSETSVPG